MANNPALFFENKNAPKPKQRSASDQEYERGLAFEYEGAFQALDLNMNRGIVLSADPDSSSIRDWVAKHFGDTSPIESECQQGVYYKRVWRPHWPGPSYRSISQTRDAEKITESLVALRILLNKLEELFETIEPVKDNATTYGHKTREILLLACMEVESSWAAVLKENGYSGATPWSTNDYVKLSGPMLLDGYKVLLRSYPHFPSFSPFGSWNSGNPTRSLPWYDAYNKTKHDREDNLKLATLDNTVQAVGAAAVMFYAQFGISFGTGFLDNISPVIRNIFNVVPDFKKYENAFYISPVQLQVSGHSQLFRLTGNR